mmetsp:Transcript_44409/g.73502  ORF Transcript_44409/g.73502 Transcript_44409/m.73502 type:complete len:221 (-) Transcript_44409:67-729(-)
MLFLPYTQKSGFRLLLLFNLAAVVDVTIHTTAASATINLLRVAIVIFCSVFIHVHATKNVFIRVVASVACNSSKHVTAIISVCVCRCGSVLRVGIAAKKRIIVLLLSVVGARNKRIQCSSSIRVVVVVIGSVAVGWISNVDNFLAWPRFQIYLRFFREAIIGIGHFLCVQHLLQIRWVLRHMVRRIWHLIIADLSCFLQIRKRLGLRNMRMWWFRHDATR